MCYLYSPLPRDSNPLVVIIVAAEPQPKLVHMVSNYDCILSHPIRKKTQKIYILFTRELFLYIVMCWWPDVLSEK